MSDDPLKVLVILGSIRAGRFGETVGNWFHGIAEQRNELDTELIDLRDWPLPFFSEPRSPATGHRAAEAKSWSEKISEADAFVVICPEYNHGYSAALKNALDHLYHEWHNKPIAFVSYGGASGGSRAVEQLRLIAVHLRLVNLSEAIVIPFAKSAFGPDGQPTGDSLNKRANSLLNQLTWWATMLRDARRATDS